MNDASRIDTAAKEPHYGPDDALDLFDRADEGAQRRTWLTVLLVGAVLVLIWFLLHHKSGDDAKADKASQAAAVTVVVPGKVEIASMIKATGTLAARREQPVGVAGEGGQVAAVLVDAGDWVRAGQVMATIDRSVQVEQQASQAAQIESAQATARLAQANLDRAMKLVARGFISKADIDRLTANRDSARAQARVASAQLGVLRAQVRRLNIVAPANGLVLERKVEPGQVVSAGSGMLFRLAKGGEMELKAMVGENDLAKLNTGLIATVVPAGSDQKFTGQIWQLAPTIDPQTRQGMARIALAYAAGLRPGGFATAQLAAGTVTAPMLPDSALLSDLKGSYVYIINAQNKAERRAVQTGTVTDNGIAIMAGLDGSERVVMRAGGFLSAGETVRPVFAPK